MPASSDRTHCRRLRRTADPGRGADRNCQQQPQTRKGHRNLGLAGVPRTRRLRVVVHRTHRPREEGQRGWVQLRTGQDPPPWRRRGRDRLHKEQARAGAEPPGPAERKPAELHTGSGSRRRLGRERQRGLSGAHKGRGRPGEADRTPRLEETLRRQARFPPPPSCPSVGQEKRQAGAAPSPVKEEASRLPGAAGAPRQAGSGPRQGGAAADSSASCP